MNSYYRNYYSLFLDYIDRFSPLRHRNVPFALLAKFQRYVGHPDIQAVLQDSQFANKHTGKEIAEEKEIQKQFDRFIPRKKGTGKRENGRVACYMHLLLLPGSFFDGYLPPDDLLAVSPAKRTGPDGAVRAFYLGDHDAAEASHIHAYKLQAADLLSKHADHPVYGHPHFAAQLIADIPKFVGVINATKTLFDRHRIRAVIVGATNDIQVRTLTLLASLRSIPSIAAQHGIIGNELGFFPVFASHLAVFGNKERLIYTSRGVDAEEITVTGHPRFDSIFTRVALSRKHVLESLGIPSGNKTVLIVTNQIRDLRAWSHYIDSLMAHENISVIIKPHRSEFEKLDGYSRLCEKHDRVKMTVSKNRMIYDLLQSVDLVATELSTVGLEAMLCRTPTVFMRKADYSSINHDYYYEQMGKYVKTDPAQLAEVSIEILTQHQVRNHNIARINRFLKDAYPTTLSSDEFGSLLSRLTGSRWRNQLALKHEGKLVKGSGKAIYLVKQGKKRLLATRQACLTRGYHPGKVVTIADTELRRIPLGVVIRS